jgi:DNA-binding MarR family transcriptional regulator
VRNTNVGRLMFNAARKFEETIHEYVRQAGIRDVRFVHLTLTRNMDFDGTRLTDLAARAGMTKQAMSELVDECEALGIVERRPDPTDRRARMIVFTARGRKLMRALMNGIAHAETEMAAAIGARAMKDMAAALQVYSAAGEERMIA